MAKEQNRQIWLAGGDPISARVLHWPDPERQDYVEMFQLRAPWVHAAANVAVFKVNVGVILQLPEAVISAIFADLSRRHIKLAIEMGLLTGELSSCGVGVEGYGAPKTAAVVVRRIKELGGELSYVAMDEPLWFGHRFEGPNACRQTITDIAHRVADGVKVMRDTFPRLMVGDIEPVPVPDATGWSDDISRWLDAYRQATGEPLAFFHADVNWNGEWKLAVPEVASRVRAEGIRFGIIYNGDGQDLSGAAWNAHAERRFVTVESGLGLVPDQAILQTWMPYPSRMLPEADPGAMTYLVDRYTLPPTTLTARRVGTQLTGRLTDGEGMAIANSDLQIAGVLASSPPDGPKAGLDGIVPDGSVTATIGLRVNTECQCFGPAEVAIGRMEYRDIDSGDRVERAFGLLGDHRLIARAGEAVAQNTVGFVVTPKHRYALSVPMAASHDSDGHGFVAIVFLDQQGEQVANNKVWFKSHRRNIGATLTDANGDFAFKVPNASSERFGSLLVEFCGDQAYRSSFAYIN